MTSIDELRSTLESHTDHLPQVDTVTRVAAVHHRIAGVRRRRRAVVAGAAASVLAVVGGVALLPSGDSDPVPADRRVAGEPAPAELASLGYTYAFDRAIAGTDGRARVDLAPSDTSRLVTWATSGDDQRVRVRSLDGQPLAYDVADFSDYVLVPPGEPTKVVVDRVDAAGDVGLAVYAVTEDAPSGVTVDGITYRRTVADRTLVDAAIGQPGQAEIALDVTSPEGILGYADLCTGAPEDAWLNVDIGDEGGYGTSCTGDSTFDPGSSMMTTRSTPGTGTIRLRLTQGIDGPLVEDPDVRLGIGLYQVPAGGVRAAGQRPAPVVEEAGHRWELNTVVESRVGDTSLTTTADRGTEPQLAILLLDGRTGLVVPKVDGVAKTAFSSRVGGVSSGGIGLVGPGARVRVGLQRNVGDDAQMAIVLYDRAD